MGDVICKLWSNRQDACSKEEARRKRKQLVKRHDFPHRKEMLAKIHIAAKDLLICTKCAWFTYWIECPKCGAEVRPVTELDYRAFLRRLTNKTTCADMTRFELENVIFALRSAGYVFTKTAHISRTNKGMARSAEDKAKLVLGTYWKKRLNGWIKKVFGVDSIYFLNQRQLMAVFGFLYKVKKETEPF